MKFFLRAFLNFLFYSREDMEKLCAHLFSKAEAQMKKCLDDSGKQTMLQLYS
jgi:hypothetical protein